MSRTTVSVTATGTQTPFTQVSTDNSMTVQLSGTYAGLTFTFEGSSDQGVTYAQIAVVDLATAQVSPGGTAISPTDNTVRLFRIPSENLDHIRVNVSAITSGTVSFQGQSGNFVGGVMSQMLIQNTSLTGNNTITGTNTITSSSASALTVGANGATNPVLKVDASTSSVATGLLVKGAAAAAGVAVSVITSGTNEALTVDAAGSGTITFGATSTGAIRFSRAAVPTASDGAALGTTALMWSDLFLASGAVVNFNNGDVTVTHSTNTLAFAGASSGYTFDAAPLPATNDGAALGSAAAQFSDLFLAEGGVINFDNGDITITQTSNVLAVAGTTSTTFDGQVNPATNDAASLGTTSLGWSDLHLATGAVINFANGEVTITETDANTLTVAGTTLIAFGATTLNVTGTRIVTSYHTNLVSTNAVTVDSSETVKRDISRYDRDAVGVVDAMDVITFRHNDHLDSGDLKIGLRAESVREPLAVDRIERADGGSYPGVNLYGLAAIHTRAIQQLHEMYKGLRDKIAG